MKTILAVIGDYYHHKAHIQASLDTAIREIPAILVYVSESELIAMLEQKPDAVILFKEDRVNPNEEPCTVWMTDEVAERIVRYVENGGGWLAWHSGMASYPVESVYTKMLRGYFKYHPNEHQIVTYEGGYPGSTPDKEQVSFAILDEHYFVHCDTDETQVFLRSRSVDGESVAGWSHSFGLGRVCCLTPAHRREGLLHAEMVQMLRRSLEWCCGGL
jgi:type 1 glutamine amidotransferase